MTVLFEFQSQIPSLTGGRDAIMEKAAELWAASPLCENARPKTRAKLAVETILAAIRTLLAAPLMAQLDAHCQSVEEEYMLMEGEEPADGDTSQAALDWWLHLYETQSAFLAGDDVAGLIGAAAVDKWVRSNEPAEALVGLILARPVEDVEHVLTLCGITQADVAFLSLPKEAEAAPPAAPAGNGHGSGEARRRSPRINGPNAVTQAAIAALEALAEAGVKDAATAEALCVSRPHVINYRAGKTFLSPTPDQLGALTALFDGAIDKLAQAIGALRSAIEMQELE